MVAKKAYFAGGCFWGVEKFFKGLTGVIDTEVGYAQSRKANPTYKDICAGKVKAIETLCITYDEDATTLYKLALMLVDTIDPYSYNKQGPDEGYQYRSGMFWTDAEQKAVYDKVYKRLTAVYNEEPLIEVSELKNFYTAEEYHQDYLDENPDAHCHIFRYKFEEATQRERHIEAIYNLNHRQFICIQPEATSFHAGKEYLGDYRPGVFVDIITGKALFGTKHRMEDELGNLVFKRPINPDEMTLAAGYKGPKKNAYLVFIPESTIYIGVAQLNDDNSVNSFHVRGNSVRFVPHEEMIEQGYGRYLDQVKAD
ncbi:MAG: peptide-methionine (S)-S-oxide reductase MsrA [Corynebacterium sp.]|nr:peptide-methionine (S)-S-oxide reductase MsrA [Corynebacterium sp.]